MLVCLLSQKSQAWTGHSKCCQAHRLAFDAAATLVLVDNCLDILRTVAGSFVFASTFVEPVGLEVAALEMDQAFEAHCESAPRISLDFDSVSIEHHLHLSLFLSLYSSSLVFLFNFPTTRCRRSYPGSSQASQKRSVVLAEGLFILWR